LDTIEDKAEEDKILDDENLDTSEKETEACYLFFDPDFPDQDSLKSISIVRRHGHLIRKILGLRSCIKKWIRILGMQPCRFIRCDILGPLKTLIDQFKSEGVLIPHTSCTHASPLVIVHKKEGGIQIAADNWEVNQYLRVSANQPPKQDILFQQLKGQQYYAEEDNLRGYHQL